MLARIARHDMFAILAVTVLAGFLRFYQINEDSLWFDEIGVALTFQAETLSALFDMVRAHVMAMPLDYIVGWLFSRICQVDACLRLPSAVWGTLSVPLSYALFRSLVNRTTALLAAFFVATFPLHIQYSQEIRFYAPMVFFYILATLLLLRAVARSTVIRWAFATFIIVLGAYFHLFVVLALFNGLIWLILSARKIKIQKAHLIGFAACGVTAALFILPGYLYFMPGHGYALFSRDQMWLNLFIGLGWLPVQFFPLQAGHIWHVLLLWFQAAGLLALLKTPSQLGWLLFSCFLQAGLILFANYVYQYGFRGRQILIFLPLLCCLAAHGAVKLCTNAVQSFEQAATLNLPGFKFSVRAWRYFGWALVAFALLLNFLNLQSYYHMVKSWRKEISLIIIQTWYPGDEVWVTPEWETDFYAYYFLQQNHQEIIPFIRGVASVESFPANSKPLCWIIDGSQPDHITQPISQALGLETIPMPSLSAFDIQTVLCRSR